MPAALLERLGSRRVGAEEWARGLSADVETLRREAAERRAS